MLTEIQWVVFVGWVIILVQCIVAWFRRRDDRYLLVAPITWALYGIIFYVLVFTGVLPSGSQLAINASSVGRLLEVILVFTAMFLLMREKQHGGK